MLDVSFMGYWIYECPVGLTFRTFITLWNLTQMKFKKILSGATLALALFSSFPAASVANTQPWNGSDKIVHGAGSAFFGFLSSAALNEWAPPEYSGFIPAFALGMVPGILRELTKPEGPCLQDFVWDLGGAAIGAALGTHFFVTPVSNNGQVNGVKVNYVERLDLL